MYEDEDLKDSYMLENRKETKLHMEAVLIEFGTKEFSVNDHKESQEEAKSRAKTRSKERVK
jgi:hypothetical protein